MINAIVTIIISTSIVDAPHHDSLYNNSMAMEMVKKKKKKGKKIGGSKGKKSKKGFFSKIFGTK